MSRRVSDVVSYRKPLEQEDGAWWVMSYMTINEKFNDDPTEMTAVLQKKEKRRYH
jgi:hypothetical protein